MAKKWGQMTKNQKLEMLRAEVEKMVTAVGTLMRRLDDVERRKSKSKIAKAESTEGWSQESVGHAVSRVQYTERAADQHYRPRHPNHQLRPALKAQPAPLPQLNRTRAHFPIPLSRWAVL